MDGEPYWNYFNSNGEYVTDSDVKGCVHGKNTFNDYYNTSGVVLKYFIATTLQDRRDQINYAAYLWNQDGRVKFYETNEAWKANIIIEYRDLDEDTVGLTRMYKNGNKVSPSYSYWDWCIIDLNQNKTVTASTVCHELGHALGLSHRVVNRNSLMKTRGRDVGWSTWMEYDVISHLY